MTEQLLNEQDVAELLKMSVHTLRQWRSANRGPRYIKLGSNVRYRPTDITTWIENQQ